MEPEFAPAEADRPLLHGETTAHDASILSPPYRAATLGMVALVSLGAFETLAIAAAMPSVAHELDGLNFYALAFGSTLATSIVGMTAAACWGDRHSASLPLYAGICCFVAGLLLAGLASDVSSLVSGRLLQGLGFGAYSVALYMVVGRCYPPGLQPRVFAAFSAAWVVPSLLGPSISGLIVQNFGWRWVFLSVPALAVPAALLMWPMTRRLVVGTAPSADGLHRIPWAIGAATGVVLLSVSGQMRGLSGLGAICASLAVLITSAHRLLPPGTLQLAPGLPSVIAMRGVAASAFFLCEAFIPLMLSREHGWSPLWAGLALSVGALTWSAGSWYQAHNHRGHSRPQLLRAGALLMSGGIAAITAAIILATPPAQLTIVAWALCGLGMGLISPSLSVLVMALSPPAQQGHHSAALLTVDAVSVSTALAVGGSLFAALLPIRSALAYLAVFVIALVIALSALPVVRRVSAAP